MGQIPADRRITTRREILWLLRGASVRGPELELFWRPTAAPRPRGTCITPRHGHTNVARNRLRRRLKEALRATLLAAPVRRDYLVRARPTAYALDYHGLVGAIETLAAQLEEGE